MEPIEPRFFGSANPGLFGVSHVSDGQFRSDGVGLGSSGPGRSPRGQVTREEIGLAPAEEESGRLGFDERAAGRTGGAAIVGGLSGSTANIVCAADDLVPPTCPGAGPNLRDCRTGSTTPEAFGARGIMRSPASAQAC